MRFVIVTGMSGAGKSTALRTMEDLGYFCVDNLPVLLIEKFAEIVRDPNFKYDKVAVGIDIRSGKKLDDLSLMLLNLKNDNFTYEILFLDMALHGGVIAACGTFFVFSDYMKPAVRLSALMELPVKFIWTHDAFRVGEDGPTHEPVEQEAQIRLMEELKNHTGEEEAVRNYVMASGEGEEFLNKISDMMEYLVPRFVENEGKNQLVVAVGCTGGRHRSVTIANLLYERLQKLPYSVRVFHRDIGMDTVIKGE